MKHLKYILITVVLFFANCEKVVDIEVPSITPKLIIDASFDVLFNEDPVVASTIVKLKLSADYFEESIPVVTDATVFVTNLSTNTVINFTDEDGTGNYKPSSFFVPKENIIYELTVIYDNQTYKGTATRIKSTPIIDVVQGTKTLFSGNEIEINVRIEDEKDVENYYFFDFSNNNYSVQEDRFFDGQLYDVPNFYEEGEIELPADVQIKMSGITKDYYTYFRILLDQSGATGGGPFEAVPAALLGNITNITNEENYPLGYFHISETDVFNMTLEDKNSN
jgi:hypothetical protein